MNTFEQLHPRTGGNGPGRPQFAAKPQTPSEISLGPAAAPVQPMEAAPQDGEVIEALFEGKTYDVNWSVRADDGSPTGVSGWKNMETGFVMLDLEGWREKEEFTSVDEEESELVALAAQRERYDRAQEARDQERADAQAHSSQSGRDTMAEYISQAFLHALRQDIARR